MKFHREGRLFIISSVLLCGVIAIFHVYMASLITWTLLVGSAALLIFILQFFRNPARTVTAPSANKIYAPADGRVVAIEKVVESEYFGDERIQLSIFMSPLNVHANRVPIPGSVLVSRHHHGKYLVAWHPKSSAENERTTVVIENSHGTLLLRQIAGAVARRIKCYLKSGQQVTQGDELGFIKFGSRCDLLLPLDAKIKVNINDTVKGNIDLIAEFK